MKKGNRKLLHKRGAQEFEPVDVFFPAGKVFMWKRMSNKVRSESGLARRAHLTRLAAVKPELAATEYSSKRLRGQGGN